MTVRLGTFDGGAFSATSGAGARGVPGGVRSLRNAFTCYVNRKSFINRKPKHKTLEHEKHISHPAAKYHIFWQALLNIIICK